VEVLAVALGAGEEFGACAGVAAVLGVEDWVGVGVGVVVEVVVEPGPVADVPAGSVAAPLAAAPSPAALSGARPPACARSSDTRSTGRGTMA
jgi:hypothetical protein